MHQPSPSSSSSQTPLPQPILQRLLFQVTSLPAFQIRRLRFLEREGLSWTLPVGQLERIVRLFLEIIPYASCQPTKDQEAQIQLNSCRRNWETVRLRKLMEHGAKPKNNILANAVSASASIAALKVLISDGLIPEEASLRHALARDGDALKVLLGAGARPSVELLKRARSEEQRRLLVEAGAFERRTNIPSGNRSLQKLASDYTTTRRFFAKPEHALSLIKRMVPKKHKAAMWMLHRALDEPAPDRKLIEYLLQHGATPTPYAMWRACAVGTPELVQLFLERGGRPDQRLADLMVALWSPREVLSLCPMIFPVQGGARITERTLALAASFSDWKVIHSFVQRGAQPSPSILARAILRLDATPDAIAKLIPKEVPGGFFHQFQRWCVLWAPHPSLLGPFAKVTPDEETLAAAVMRGRLGFVQQLLDQKAPLTDGIKLLALHCRGMRADRIVRLLAHRDTSFAYAKQIVTHGTLQMARATLQEHNSQQKEELFRIALGRKDNAAKVADLFFEKGATYSKALRYLVCERGSSETIRALFKRNKVTRHAVERCMRHPRPSPGLISMMMKRASWKGPSLPNSAFLGVNYRSPKAVHTYWKLMERLLRAHLFSDWLPPQVVLNESLRASEQRADIRSVMESVLTQLNANIVTGAPLSFRPSGRTVSYPSKLANNLWCTKRGISIQCRRNINNDELQELAAQFPQLKGLNLSKCHQLSDEGFIASLKLWTSLECLNLRNGLSKKSIQALAEQSSQLKRLELSDTLVESSIIETLASNNPQLYWIALPDIISSPNKAIETLTQHCPEIRYADFRHLKSNSFSLSVLSKRGWSHLEEINLDKTGIQDSDLSSLAEGCKELRHISLKGCQAFVEDSLEALAKGCPHLLTLNPGDLRALAYSEQIVVLRALVAHCPGIQEASLAECIAGDEIVSVFSGKWEHLRKVDLTHWDLTDTGVQQLVKGRSHLREIIIEQGHITDKAVQIIARNCPQLQRLLLRGHTNLGNVSLEALAHHCPHLQEIKIGWIGDATDAGLTKLAKGCPALQHIRIRANLRVTCEGIDALVRSCDDLKEVKVSGIAAFDERSLSDLRQSYPHVKFKLRGSDCGPC